MSQYGTPADRYAVCELVLRMGSFADDVALAAAAGIGAIGVDADAVDAIGAREARRILDGNGVRASSYMGIGFILAADGSTLATSEAARRLDIAATLGASGALVLTGPLGAHSPGEAEALCRDWLGGVAPLASERGVRLMVEPVHPIMRKWSFVHSMRHGLALVDGIDGAGLVFDVGHVWWEYELEALVAEHVSDVATVQVTNIDGAALNELRYDRVPLDQGEVPVASLVPCSKRPATAAGTSTRPFSDSNVTGAWKCCTPRVRGSKRSDVSRQVLRPPLTPITWPVM